MIKENVVGDYKFKAKMLQTNKWIYGDYVSIKDKCWILPEGIGSEVETDPETVCMFSGIFDVNGKEIYEHDIIKSQFYSDRPHSNKAKYQQHMGEVIRNIKCGNGFGGDLRGKTLYWGSKFDVKLENVGDYSCCSWSPFWSCVVVGNIFDNIEILKEELPILSQKEYDNL